MGIGDFPLGTFKKGDSTNDYSNIENANPTIKTTRFDVLLQLNIARQAKLRHKDSPGCTQRGECTGCHFWSGAISALSEILGEPGVID